MRKLVDYWAITPIFAVWIIALVFLLLYYQPFGCNQFPQDSCNGSGGSHEAARSEVVQPELEIQGELTPYVEDPNPGTWDTPELKESPVAPQKACCDDYLRAACRIRGGGSGGSGTCYRIDDKYVYVLTCRHVVGKTKEFIVEFWIDGRITGKYVGKVYRILDVDAAVIRVPVSVFKEDEFPIAIPISRVAPIKGKSIMSVGSPGLGWQTLFEGYITKMGSVGNSRPYNNSKQSFKFIPPPKGGRSGSAIFQDGKIVGVLWGSTEKNGYAVNCMDLQSLNMVSNLYFTAEWCQYCREMEPVIAQLDGVQVIDYDLNTAFAELYGIKSLPAYVNQQGETISGVKTLGELQEFYGKFEVPLLDVEGPE